MNQCLRSLAYCVAFVSLALLSTEAVAKSHKSPVPAKKHEAKGGKAGKQRNAAAGKGKHAKHAAKHKAKDSGDAADARPVTPPLTGDLADLPHSSCNSHGQVRSGHRRRLERS